MAGRRCLRGVTGVWRCHLGQVSQVSRGVTDGTCVLRNVYYDLVSDARCLRGAMMINILKFTMTKCLIKSCQKTVKVFRQETCKQLQ